MQVIVSPQKPSVQEQQTDKGSPSSTSEGKQGSQQHEGQQHKQGKDKKEEDAPSMHHGGSFGT
jgi:hypothetical protein